MWVSSQKDIHFNMREEERHKQIKKKNEYRTYLEQQNHNMSEFVEGCGESWHWKELFVYKEGLQVMCYVCEVCDDKGWVMRCEVWEKMIQPGIEHTS